MDGVADEEEIDGFKRQLGTVRPGENELRRVGGVHVDDALFGVGQHLRFDVDGIDHPCLGHGFDEAACEVS